MTITVLLILIIAALLACAVTPPEVKAKNPKVWMLLESLAINVGSAQNSAGPAGSPRLALVAYVAAAVALLYPQATPSPTAAGLAPAVTFVAIPHDPTPTVIPADVTP